MRIATTPTSKHQKKGLLVSSGNNVLFSRTQACSKNNAPGLSSEFYQEGEIGGVSFLDCENETLCAFKDQAELYSFQLIFRKDGCIR